MTSARPPQFSWVSPYITVSNVDASIDFYQKAFKFSLKEKNAGEDGKTFHAEMLYKDQILMLGQEGKYGEIEMKTPNTLGTYSPIHLYIYCENVDEFYKHALSEGAESFSAPEDMFWSDRMCRLTCPNGYVWAFATYSGVPCNQK